MPCMLQKAVPILASLDIRKTTMFWLNMLGFETLHQEEEYAIVQRDAVQIHFWKCDDESIPAVTACRVGVHDIRALHGEFEPKGVIHPNGALGRRPWGTSEFAILDGDGNLVTFFEPAE